MNRGMLADPIGEIESIGYRVVAIRETSDGWQCDIVKDDKKKDAANKHQHTKISSQKVHFCLAMFWIAMMIPTLLWWKDSILWVAMMSLYANIETSFSAYQAARAESGGG